MRHTIKFRRIIKFRAQRFDNRKWVYGDLEYNPGNKVARIHSYDSKGSYEGQHIVIPESVCQFTGLLDRNGKEIYEGDITKAGTGEVYEICWYDDLASFMAEMVYNEKPFMLFDIESARQSVIGNIYDNPELLK